MRKLIGHADLPRYQQRCNELAEDALKSNYGLGPITEVTNVIQLTARTLTGILLGPQRPRKEPEESNPEQIKLPSEALCRLDKKIKVLRKDYSRLLAAEVQQLRFLPAGKHYQAVGQKWKAVTPKGRQLALLKIRRELSRNAALARNIRNSELRKVQERTLQQNPKRYLQSVYDKELGEQTLTPDATPNDAHERFWREIWSQDSPPDGDYSTIHWLNEHRLEVKCNKQESSAFTMDELRAALREMPSWKAAGWEGIHTFWLKYLPCIHETLLKEFNRILTGASSPPEWLTTGKTHLIRKINCEPGPKSYRPINCLPVIYKLLTKMIANRLTAHMEPLLTDEQKECRTNTKGTMHQLLFDRIQEAVSTEMDLGVAWLDVAKAFDTVKHSWILETLRIYKVDERLIHLIKLLMESWSVKLAQRGETISDRIKIKRGIFQGDSLSPLLFIIALNPISADIAKQDMGVALSGKYINHLLYVDDWKLYPESKKDKLVSAVRERCKIAGLELNEKKSSFMIVLNGTSRRQQLKELRSSKT